MLKKRRKTRKIKLGNVEIGGNSPISVQSMTNTDTRDVKSTIEQIKRLENAGCEIVRVAVPDMEAAKRLAEIKNNITIPLIADIHFDYRLALESIKQGVDGLRLNPGNIGSLTKVKQVVENAREKNIPIRIGVNAGSLDKKLLDKYGGVTPAALVESALEHINYLEKLNYTNLKISLKASNIELMFHAYKLLAEKVDYPFHIGVTEAGTVLTGAVKSSVGITLLLNEGLGDTLRVSLTGPPEKEVQVGYDILRCLGLRERGVQLISCPTCGRCGIDLQALAEEVEKRTSGIQKHLKVAVMGCPVNGPGEAREADVGIAGGKEKGLLFSKGKKLKTVPQNQLVDELMKEIDKILDEGKEEES
ncbi:MAG: (E)-4-hydroxy-3-methylbut-2-enyl-diphosphate synthase [Clostridia bacterium]|jgi:(E)-4-hydroxy-3-methylbut-2-enyl-diphosphate synthase|nr:(E)-4-hydroxy-3-methylbut-2-enyl-diphosphate synthase [Clostridia bacterium]